VPDILKLDPTFPATAAVMAKHKLQSEHNRLDSQASHGDSVMEKTLATFYRA